MHSDSFEHAFSEFLERREYDEAENALFSVVRAAFLAGWKAAGGEVMEAQRVLYLHKEQPRDHGGMV